ncbi:hypothetical protein M9Y10_000106 [Tritrichomonas musculus]|uniref:D-isomer specific 2-hydroxyacid dehydrogenase NAD-binding domain-containing protein n=1 Tax=Tritrichomonas musculus TaxID=1915356 RepID=A0ABR2L3D4_9EUKA
MRKIAVYTSFMTDKYRQRIKSLSSSLGFTVDFYNSDEGHSELESRVSEYEVIFGHPPPSILKSATSLRWLCSDFAGIEGYLDDRLWPNPSCLLSNSSGAYGASISEHVLMVSLMLLRRMPEYQAELALKKWKSFSPIRSIAGSYVLLLGTGDIGTNTARRMKALGATVVGVCRSGKHDEKNLFEKVVSVDEIESVIGCADILVMSLPETAQTKGILSRERIALLKPSALVINVGRGSAIDQEALVDALNEGRLAGAALDVMVPEPLPADHPLWRCPNTIITPHVSGDMSLGLTCDLDVEMFCKDLSHYAAGEKLEQLVDRVRGY